MRGKCKLLRTVLTGHHLLRGGGGCDSSGSGGGGGSGLVSEVGSAYRETSGSRHFSSPAGDLWRLEGRKEGWDDGMDHG